MLEDAMTNDWPGDHLLNRYGRRARGDVPVPDCELCWEFVNDLPVRSIAAWIKRLGSRNALRMRRRSVAALTH